MALMQTPVCEFGWPAAEFDLPGVDGKRYSLQSARGPRGLLVMFICNHCPYVKAVLPRIERDVRDLQAIGVGCIAINANDAAAYPEDSFAAMQVIAREKALPFPYVWDETQATARTYGAICTPDFFGFNAQLQLQYRGRLDESRTTPAANAPRELFEAMQRIADTGNGPRQQIPSMGCSIKWKS